jgi:hypothetical protein
MYSIRGMLNMKRKDLIESIANKIKNYRKGEIAEIGPANVERWVKQFDKKDQRLILKEMDHLLGEYYFSREEVKEYLRELFSLEELLGKNPKKKLRNSQFLNIQTKGTSQKDLLELVDEILMEEHDLSISDCTGSDTYFYIDDCIFTGNRLRYDLVPWIEKTDFSKRATIITYCIAHHSEGFNYANRYVSEAARQKDVRLSHWYAITINNSTFPA